MGLTATEAITAIRRGAFQTSSYKFDVLLKR
jgi:hypothetical protein